MSSCFTGNGRVCGLDLEMSLKSPSFSSTASTVTSHSSISSSSPTISESGGNSPFTISTRKPRTPRKRPNQIYNEAAVILSTAYPKIFSAKQLAGNKPCKFVKPQSVESFFMGNSSSDSASELLIPLRVPVDNPAGFLLHPPIVSEKPGFIQADQRARFSTVSEYSSDEMCWRRPMEVGSPENFETESILAGEIDEGIDSIMENSNYQIRDVENLCNNNNVTGLCYGYPVEWGMKNEAYSHEWRLTRAGLKQAAADDGDNSWRYPIVNVTEISPKLYPSEKKTIKKKKKKLLKNIIADEKPPSVTNVADEKPRQPHVADSSKPNQGLQLKLNHDNLLAAWSDRGSPFSEQPTGAEPIGNNLHAEIDLLFGEREARVLRYKEKRRTRLFSKKIRYHVRKVNADQRPRMKGRFVRRPNSPF